VKGPTLAELILTARGAGTFEDLRVRAEQLGCPSKANSWQQWANPSFERRLLPDPATIRAFAAGMQVPQTEVLLAAGRQVGLDVGQDNGSDLVLAGAAKLPAEDRLMISNMVSFLLLKNAE
jgi:hypothetical protein